MIECSRIRIAIHWWSHGSALAIIQYWPQVRSTHFGRGCRSFFCFFLFFLARECSCSTAYGHMFVWCSRSRAGLPLIDEQVRTLYSLCFCVGTEWRTYQLACIKNGFCVSVCSTSYRHAPSNSSNNVSFHSVPFRLCHPKVRGSRCGESSSAVG